MTILTADKIGDKHRYIKRNLPNYRRSMSNIRNCGGPWKCDKCDGPSYLSYRCSVCGSDLTD